MKKMFEKSMVGEMTYFLGLQVKQMDSGIYINQAKYARNLVKRFGHEKPAHAKTPMAANAKLTNDASSEFVDITLYRSMIGCLLYLTAVGLILLLVLVFVLDFNLILKFHI